MRLIRTFDNSIGKQICIHCYYLETGESKVSHTDVNAE